MNKRRNYIRTKFLIAAAWELVEETGNAFLWGIFQMHSRGRTSSWGAEINAITDRGLVEVITVRCAPTAPIAICRAWLAWKGLGNES